MARIGKERGNLTKSSSFRIEAGEEGGTKKEFTLKTILSGENSIKFNSSIRCL